MATFDDPQTQAKFDEVIENLSFYHKISPMMSSNDAPSTLFKASN